MTEKPTIETAPIGTKAPAASGGYWVKISPFAWKWAWGSSTFTRPGGDWTGELIPPAELD